MIYLKGRIGFRLVRLVYSCPYFTKNFTLLQQCQLMLLVYCNIQRLPSCKVMRVTQTCQNGGVNGIQISLVGFLHEGGKPEPQYCPQIFRPQLPTGEVVYAMVFKPHNFQLGVKYPTVLNVYGGPEVQTVNNTFKVSAVPFSSSHKN